MYPEITSRLKDRFQYDVWHGRNRLPENLFIWKFFFFGDEMPNWSATRMEHIEVDDQPKIVESLWETMSESSLTSPEKPAGLLNVQSIECKSRDQAHNFLLRFLGEFEGPLIYRWDETELGDVTFTVPGYDLILFARANLIHLVRNAGQLREPVTEVATALDQVLTRKPEAPEPKSGRRGRLSAMAPRIEKLETPVKEVRVGESVPLDLEVAPFETELLSAQSLAMRAATEPVQRVQFRIFSPAGEVHEEGGRLHYTPQQSGLQDVNVFALNAARVATKKKLQLKASD